MSKQNGRTQDARTPEQVRDELVDKLGKLGGELEQIDDQVARLLERKDAIVNEISYNRGQYDMLQGLMAALQAVEQQHAPAAAKAMLDGDGLVIEATSKEEDEA